MFLYQESSSLIVKIICKTSLYFKQGTQCKAINKNYSKTMSHRPKTNTYNLKESG